MSPNLAECNTTYGRSADPEGVSDLAIWNTIRDPLAHIDHGCVRQFGACVLLATWHTGHQVRSLVGPMFLTSRGVMPHRVPVSQQPTALYGHVFSVLRRCPQEQMARPHAWWIVAMVADIESLRDRPESQSPRNPVCPLGWITPQTDMAIASAPKRSSPEPAFVGLIDACPEPIREGCRRSFFTRGSEAEVRAVGIGPVDAPSVSHAASHTQAGDSPHPISI
jgi:hypothetical protein